MHRIAIRNCNWILRYAEDDESKYSPGTVAGVTSRGDHRKKVTPLLLLQGYNYLH